jgi:predicted RNA binding protein YcfA (HicA-like mRNA interferase family)
VVVLVNRRRRCWRTYENREDGVTVFQLQCAPSASKLMSKHQKALEKLCTTPPASDIKWNELVAVLSQLGYKELKGKGSRRKFHHAARELLIICHRPHPSPEVDKGCIVDVAEHLRANGFI